MAWFGRRSASDGQYFPGDEQFLSGVKEAHVLESSVTANWVIYLMLTVVLSAAAWASVAKVEQITKAEGRVVSDGREQIIASLEGGILGSMFVREGMLVEQGQDLLRLDPTRVEAQQNEGQAKRVALMATVARLQAEANGKPLSFPPEVLADKAVVQAETESYDARRQALNDAVAVTRRSLDRKRHV